MPSLPARRPIVLHAAFEVLSNLATALPCGPSFVRSSSKTAVA